MGLRAALQAMEKEKNRRIRSSARAATMLRPSVCRRCPGQSPAFPISPNRNPSGVACGRRLRSADAHSSTIGQVETAGNSRLRAAGVCMICWPCASIVLSYRGDAKAIGYNSEMPDPKPVRPSFVIVVGGHSRNIGKTSVAAALIAAFPQLGWTAMKITQFGHGICSMNGRECGCAIDEHAYAIMEERNREGRTDTSRFLWSQALDVLFGCARSRGDWRWQCQNCRRSFALILSS